MQQLLSDDVSQLETFFSDPQPNDPMLRAYLNGRVPGHALVDDLPEARACAVAVNYRFVFFGGAAPNGFVEQVAGRLRSEQPIEIVWPSEPARLPRGLAPDTVVDRIEFRRRESRGGTHLETLAAGTADVEVCRIDSRLMPRCLWRDDVLRATGSTSEFLGHGLGFCLMREDAIVAEAYAVIWNGERAEIATVTHPDHRGRGYATVVCASLIKACEGVGLSTYWNCDAHNAASVRLAARLGYADPHAYRLLRFDQMATPRKRATKKKGAFSRFARRLFGPDRTRR